MMNEMQNVTEELNEIVSIINNAKENAIKKVNEELIKMYWKIGKFLSEKAKTSSYGDKFIDEIAQNMLEKHPDLKGFNRRGLYRMKQFYETYADDKIVSPLVTQLSWTNNLLIMSGTKQKKNENFM